MTIYSVNTAPCRVLPWGKSPLNVKNCVSPTGLDHSKNREPVCLDHCPQIGPVSGNWRDRNAGQTIKCPKCGTHPGCRVQTNPFRNLGSLGGWTLGSTNVKGGLHLVLTRSPKIYKLLCTSSQEPFLARGITSVYGQDAVGPIQNLWVSSTFLGSKTTQPLETYCRSEQPNLSEAIRTTLQQWKWVTSIDFKDTYFHLSIQEHSRTYQISCPGSGIPVQSTVLRSVLCTMDLTVVARS